MATRKQPSSKRKAKPSGKSAKQSREKQPVKKAAAAKKPQVRKPRAKKSSAKAPPRPKAAKADTLAAWRGAPCLDFNMLLLMAHAPLDEAEAAFAKAFKVRRRVKDVLGKRVTVSDSAYLAYQLRGHSWSIFDLLTLGRGTKSPAASAGQALSKALGGKALFLGISDTGGYYEYAVYDRGKLLQRYCDPGMGDPIFESADPEATPPSPNEQLTDLFDKFMTEQDALVPPFGPADMWLSIPWTLPADVQVGEWEEFTKPHILRADLILLK